MTHRDGFPRLSARSAWRGDAGRREPRAPSQSYAPPESLGKPPFRSRRRPGSGRNWCGRRKALTMSRRTCGSPPTRSLARRIACPISMGHYQRSLVFIGCSLPEADNSLVIPYPRSQDHMPGDLRRAVGFRTHQIFSAVRSSCQKSVGAPPSSLRFATNVWSSSSMAGSMGGA